MQAFLKENMVNNLSYAADPLYGFLKSQKGGILTSDVKWNFTKFLINKDGEVVKRYGRHVVIVTSSGQSTAQQNSAYVTRPPLAILHHVLLALDADLPLSHTGTDLLQTPARLKETSRSCLQHKYHR